MLLIATERATVKLAAQRQQTATQAQWYEGKLKGVRKESAEKASMLSRSIKEEVEQKVALEARMEVAPRSLESLLIASDCF